jgi:hypothetical protein
MFFYLAGSIEYSPDLGKGWRAQITPALKPWDMRLTILPKTR